MIKRLDSPRLFALVCTEDVLRCMAKAMASMPPQLSQALVLPGGPHLVAAADHRPTITWYGFGM
jgi:hypothetical protein